MVLTSATYEEDALYREIEALYADEPAELHEREDEAEQYADFKKPSETESPL